MKYLVLATIALSTTACTPARIAADAAVTTGQVVLGAADMLL